MRRCSALGNSFGSIWRCSYDKTARQLKDLIRNLSKDKAADAQILMRNYMMERFLERISLSEYRDKFILKGGMLVAAMVGLDARSTMDIDATVKGATVGIEEVENMIASMTRASSLLISGRRSLQRPRNAVQRSILPTHLRPLMRLRPTRTRKNCGGHIRRSSPMPPTCRGIRSWNPSAAFIGWRRGKRPTNRKLLL